MSRSSRRYTGRVWLLGVLMACLSVTTPAFSQSSAANKAAAEALFNEGRTLMQQENYTEACKKLEASQALDVGLGTMMLLSDCYEKLGKTASAWASFKDAAAAARAAGDHDREEVARARADALEPTLAKALVQASPKTRSLGGLEVMMNGHLIPLAQLGTPVPVDPGTLEVRVAAAGYEPWEFSTEIVEGASETTVDIPELAPEKAKPSAPAAQPETADAAPPPRPTTPEDQAVTEPESNLKTVGLVVGAAGIVGIGVGSYFGIRASSKNSDSKDDCTNNVCSAEGLELREDAQDAATMSTITFGVGAALLATGIVLYLVSPEASGAQALSLSAGPRVGGAEFSLGGNW